MISETIERIKNGRPMTAVPVSPSDSMEAGRLSHEAALSGADIIELRADADAAVGDNEELLRLLRAVREGAGDRLVLVTVRTSEQGGAFDGNAREDERILLEAAGSGLADLIDVEWRRDISGDLTRSIRGTDTAVISSDHDFEGTPPYDELVSRMRAMAGTGADIIKGAYMPSSADQVSDVIGAEAFISEDLFLPSVLISMGERGALSRTNGCAFGSAFSFGCLPGRESAPGQTDAGELRRMLEALPPADGSGYVFLTGFMGSGKSTVAELLALKRGLEVIDADAEISKRAGMSIPEIFGSMGEEAFREMESDFLVSLAAARTDRGAGPCVVSCGGGMPLREKNRAMMRKLGRVIFLDISPSEAMRRLAEAHMGRPVLGGDVSEKKIAELMGQRRSSYLAAAHYVISADGKEPEETAEEAASLFLAHKPAVL